ncbi:MAG TPA: family 16 glycosylhydrolase [Caldilineaceae bacterium]|nr:family 16 glycosylhydrolase [Caldilineaceae bacterium]
MTINPATLNRHSVGSGRLEVTAVGARMGHGPTTRHAYTNAQLDDYQSLRRRDFAHRPPLVLSLRARFSHNTEQLHGTAGFGFWNDPFGMTGARLPTLPRALWFFFSSPPSNMALARDVPGPGWKAATIDAWRWPFWLLAPTTPIAMPLMKIPALYRRLWPIGQRAIAVHEALLPCTMTAWHDYRIEWLPTQVRFWVDGQPVLQADQSPGGPLGLVIWKDNQAMSVTPSSVPHHQLVASTTEEWLEIGEMTLHR